MTERCSLALDGVLRVGTQSVASKLKGWLHAQLDRHDPRQVSGAQIFGKISVNTELDADLPSFEFTRLYRSSGSLELSRGKGSVHARVQIEHGAWQKNTAIRYQTAGVTVARRAVAVTGPLVLDASLVESGSESGVEGGSNARLELAAKSPHLALTVRGSPAEIANPSLGRVRLVLGVSADPTRLAEPQTMRMRAQLELPALRWLNDLLEREGLFSHGSSRAEIDLRWSKGKPGDGTIAIETKQARFALAENVLQVSGTANARLTYDGATERGMFDELELELPHVAVANGRDWEALPGGLRAQAEWLRWQGEPPRRVQGRFTLDAESVKPFLPFVISSSILRSIAKLVISLGETHAVVELDRRPEVLELRLEEASSAKLRVFGILRSEKNEPDPCGRFFLQNPTLNFGIELHRGHTSIKPFASSNWWRERPPTTSCGPGFNPPVRVQPESSGVADARAKSLARR
jgi:hypothetical protein